MKSTDQHQPTPADPEPTRDEREPLTDEESLLLATAIAQFLRDLKAKADADEAGIDPR